MKGYKTYIFAALIGLATAVVQLGWIDQKLYEALLAFLGAGGLAALRSGVKNG